MKSSQILYEIRAVKFQEMHLCFITCLILYA